MKTVIVLCSILSVALASPYKLCSPAAGEITSVDIKDCSNDVSSCILHKGTDASIAINFKSPVDAASVTVKAFGIIGGIPLPYPLNNSDACKDSGITCPVKAETGVAYTQSFKVEKFYPSIGLNVKWTLVNESGKQLLCVMIPVKIE
ncbi:NPC intracellular cholesterol transporter 2 homolog a [Galendromus occidentalis]|uniref:NPC intracellular cholesterol transporter 2 homolog a n=1 Tax=Galendromus occidentalis TaxID=34638 RepID=A0AAJ7L6N5_9ACAR|nr:NPC intracellular cholesterol transporter 2 homolog a [Galendromus occidentalis]